MVRNQFDATATELEIAREMEKKKIRKDFKFASSGDVKAKPKSPRARSMSSWWRNVETAPKNNPLVVQIRQRPPIRDFILTVAGIDLNAWYRLSRRRPRV